MCRNSPFFANGTGSHHQKEAIQAHNGLRFGPELYCLIQNLIPGSHAPP